MDRCKPNQVDIRGGLNKDSRTAYLGKENGVPLTHYLDVTAYQYFHNHVKVS